MLSYLTKLNDILSHKTYMRHISPNLMALYLTKLSSEHLVFVPIRNNIRNLPATNSNDAYVWKHAFGFVMKFVTSGTQGNSKYSLPGHINFSYFWTNATYSLFCALNSESLLITQWRGDVRIQLHRVGWQYSVRENILFWRIGRNNRMGKCTGCSS